MGLASFLVTNAIRDILVSNDLLIVIRELLGDTPNNSVIEEDDDEYRTHRHLFMIVQYTILHPMSNRE